MRRGDIYWVNLEPAFPPEFGKVRPGLIVSNSEQNAVLSSVVVVPISSRPPEIWPLRLALTMKTSKGKPSFAVIPGIRQVSKLRLQKKIGIVTNAFVLKLNEALSVYLQDDL